MRVAYYQKRPETEHNGPINLVILGALVVFGVVLFSNVAGFLAAQSDFSLLQNLAGPPRFSAIEKKLDAETVSVARPITSDQMAAISPVGVIRNYAYCETGQVPTFRNGMEQLRAAVGVEMGVPMECEHSTASGSSQQTTTGTASYDSATSTARFANKAYVWQLAPDGGVSIEEAPAS